MFAQKISASTKMRISTAAPSITFLLRVMRQRSYSVIALRKNGGAEPLNLGRAARQRR